MENAKEAIERAGGEYLGSVLIENKGELHQFNDPVTHSTLAMWDCQILCVNDVIAKMALHRKKFAEASA